MTATLPPSAVKHVKAVLNFTTSEVLRASSDRANLQYEIKHVRPPRPGSHASAQELFLEEAKAACEAFLQQALLDPAGRIIVFVRRRDIGDLLAEYLGCHLYHADISDRSRVLTAWNQGASSPMRVATSTLSAGVDYPSVRGIIHLDAPTGLLDYAQETGPAERD